MRQLLWFALLLIASCIDDGGARAQSVETIRHAGHFDCGTVQNADDWDAASVHGNLSAFDSEICRAIGVAIMGQKAQIAVHAYPSETGALKGLQDGEVATVIGVSPSASMARLYGLRFSQPVFFDSQRILVAAKSGITHLADLKDRLICAMDLSPPEQTLHDVMKSRNIPYALMTHSEQGEMDAAISVHRCIAGTAMETRLAQSRANFRGPLSDYEFLPDRLAIAPITAAYRASNESVGLIVDWTINALIEAEALGVTHDETAAAAQRDDLRGGLLSGHDFASAQALGLAHDWALQVVAATGNYGEIFERTISRPYHLERGLNALWTEGGLLYAPPMK
jgi:general L-amino acid transport system substrate-binding protein